MVGTLDDLRAGYVHLDVLAQRAEGRSRLAAGDREGGLAALRSALEAFERLPDVFEAARTREALADALPAERDGLLRAALSAYEQLGTRCNGGAARLLKDYITYCWMLFTVKRTKGDGTPHRFHGGRESAQDQRRQHREAREAAAHALRRVLARSLREEPGLPQEHRLLLQVPPERHARHRSRVRLHRSRRHEAHEGAESRDGRVRQARLGPGHDRPGRLRPADRRPRDLHRVPRREVPGRAERPHLGERSRHQLYFKIGQEQLTMPPGAEKNPEFSALFENLSRSEILSAPALRKLYRPNLFDTAIGVASLHSAAIGARWPRPTSTCSMPSTTTGSCARTAERIPRVPARVRSG